MNFEQIGQPLARIQIAIGETAHAMSKWQGERNSWVSAAYYIMSDKKIPNVYIKRGVRRKVLLHAFRTLLSCWDSDPDIHKLKDGK